MVINDKIQCKSCFAPLDMKKPGAIIRCDYCSTDNVISQEVRVVRANDTLAFRKALFVAMSNVFSLDDIREIIVLVSPRIPGPYPLQYDSISGSNVRVKIMELIDYCNRRGALQELVDVVISTRPNIDIIIE